MESGEPDRPAWRPGWPYIPENIRAGLSFSLNLYNSAVEIMERIIKVDPNNLVWESDV